MIIRNLTRNLEIKNTPVWAQFNTWRLEWARATKFGMNISNNKPHNTEKDAFTAFIVSELLKESKKGGEEGEAKLPTPRLGTIPLSNKRCLFVK